jgi:hypothetical protein
VGPNGPVDDDGGAPISCPSATCALCPNGTGDVGPCGHRKGGVRPAKTGGMSTQRALRLDPQPGECPRRAVVGCLLQGLSRRTSLPTLMLEVCPQHSLSLRGVPRGPTAYGGHARPLSLGVGRGGHDRSLIVGIERGGRA